MNRYPVQLRLHMLDAEQSRQDHPGKRRKFGIKPLTQFMREIGGQSKKVTADHGAIVLGDEASRTKRNSAVVAKMKVKRVHFLDEDDLGADLPRKKNCEQELANIIPEAAGDRDP